MGQFQTDLESHRAKFNPAPAHSQSTSAGSRPSAAPPRRQAVNPGGPYKVVVRSSVFARRLLVSENFDTELEAVNEARKYNRKMVNIRIKVTDRNGNNVAW